MTEPVHAIPQSPPRLQSRSSRTRAALIETAVQLIARKGIGETSVVDITEAVGISNGAFYYHFTSKDHLLEEVGHVLVASLVERIEASARTDPARQVARGPFIVLRYVDEHPQLRLILLQVMEDPEQRHVILSDGLKASVSEGMASGRFPAGDIGFAIALCRSIIACGVRRFEPGGDWVEMARLCSRHTLAVLGLPWDEAGEVVTAEYEAIVSESLPDADAA